MSKCLFRLYLPTGKTPVLQMPQADWFEAHQALLAALGIPDSGPVRSEGEAESLASAVCAAYLAIAAQDAESGKSMGKKRK